MIDVEILDRIIVYPVFIIYELSDFANLVKELKPPIKVYQKLSSNRLRAQALLPEKYILEFVPPSQYTFKYEIFKYQGKSWDEWRHELNTMSSETRKQTVNHLEDVLKKQYNNMLDKTKKTILELGFIEGELDGYCYLRPTEE